MTETEKNSTPTRNLTTREIVLTNIGPQCGRCGYKEHLAPLVIRAEGLTQNRKTTNYAQYWLAVLGLSVSNPSAIDVICRNCMAIEQEEQKAGNNKPSKETIYIYSTDLSSNQINKRQQFLDALEEPKRVYIITGDDTVWQYKGDTRKGSSWSVNFAGRDSDMLFAGIDIRLATSTSGLFRLVDNKLEPVT